jgi:hypothetical protein
MDGWVEPHLEPEPKGLLSVVGVQTPGLLESDDLQSAQRIRLWHLLAQPIMLFQNLCSHCCSINLCGRHHRACSDWSEGGRAYW